MMSNNPNAPLNLSNINNVNVSFQFNIQPGLGTTTKLTTHHDKQLSANGRNVDDAQLQSLMASTLGLLSNLQNYQRIETSVAMSPTLNTKRDNIGKQMKA